MFGRAGLDGDELMSGDYREYSRFSYRRLHGYEDWYSAPLSGKKGGDRLSFWLSVFVMLFGVLVIAALFWAGGGDE